MKLIQYILIITILINHNTSAQDYILLSGKLINIKTNEPVRFATISLCNFPLGVVTNEFGEFTFNIRDKYKDESICISCLGYKSIIKSLNEMLLDTGLVHHYIEPIAYGIDEVKISSKRKRIKPIKIVKLAIEAIPNNYPTEPFILIGYYRDYLKQKREYVNLLEAALEIEDKGFNNPDYESTKIKILQTRFSPDYYYDKTKSISYDNMIRKYIPGAYLPDYGGNEFSILRVHDPIRNHDRFSFSFIDIFSKDFLSNHSFSIDSVTILNDKYIYCINFSYRNRYEEADYLLYEHGYSPYNRKGVFFDAKGKIYISADNYSINKITYANFFNDNIHQGKMYEFIAEYKEFKSKMYLNYLSLHNYFEMQDFSDQSYFRVVTATYNKENNTVELIFNNAIDSISALNPRNYSGKSENTKFRIEKVKIMGPKKVILKLSELYLQWNVVDIDINIKKVFDKTGNEINTYKTISMYQFREFFTSEVKVDNYSPIPYSQSFAKTFPLYLGRRDKDTDFWDQFNYVRNKPLIK